MTRNAIKAQVTEVKAALDKAFCTEFTIYDPGYHASGWTIISEEAAYAWPFSADMATIQAAFPWLLIEPVNHWSVAVYDETPVSNLDVEELADQAQAEAEDKAQKALSRLQSIAATAVALQAAVYDLDPDQAAMLEGLDLDLASLSDEVLGY